VKLQNLDGAKIIVNAKHLFLDAIAKPNAQEFSNRAISMMKKTLFYSPPVAGPE